LTDCSNFTEVFFWKTLSILKRLRTVEKRLKVTVAAAVLLQHKLVKYCISYLSLSVGFQPLLTPVSVAVLFAFSARYVVSTDVFVRGLLCIHPSFRIVALAEPPVVGSTSQQWLNAEQLTMFLYHHMRSLSVTEELHVLSQLVSQHTHTHARTRGGAFLGA